MGEEARTSHGNFFVSRSTMNEDDVHGRVRIRDAALVAAAVLSDRYISGRFLPDKAIDLVDESASRLRMEIDSSPLELDEADRRVRQLEIELAAMANESKDVREPIERELADAKEERDALAARWAQEKGALERVKEITKRIDELKMEAERAERQGELQRVAEIRYGELPALEQELTERDGATPGAREPMVKEEVDQDDIAAVVARWTGIPVSRLLEGETEKLIHMEERLHQRVVGQDEAVEAVANALRRARTGLQDPDRPIGSFVFLGPTGVGKTELAKALAEFMFGSEDALIKIDMSEFMERHNVSRLVGAPPGYVGFDEGGQLTEAVRRKSYCVILLDEIEKAHPEVFNILLQILEDGHLSDAKGRRVDFRNCIIIMTSNLGARQLQTNSSLGFRVQGDTDEQRATASYDLMKDKVQNELKQTFRPEFLNRLDATVVFRSLTVEEIRQIVDLMLARVRDQLKAQGMTLEVTQAAKDHIIKIGYDVAYGARPLRRVIQNMIEDVLAEQLLLGQYKNGMHIVVDKNSEAGLDIHVAEEKQPAEVAP